jgi:hypothetical protein
MSSEMAWRAASLITSGAAKSGNRQVDGVVLERETRHFANDGFGEFFGFGRKHSASDVGGGHGQKKV